MRTVWLGRVRRVGGAVAALALLGAPFLAGCAATEGGASQRTERAERAGERPRATPAPERTSPAAPAQAAAPAPEPEPEPAYQVSDGAPRDAVLSIPDLGIEGLAVETYRGRTDDAAGHAIQNTGIAASPHGPAGGTGPGGIGNYQVTGHRNSAGAIFYALPDLERGDRVVVEATGTAYVYEVRSTRITSFRSERSLAEQRAAVPGRPGATPTRAMITLSTCRTQEDHAEGNYWADELDNPEHRIDKIGVLVRTRPA